jgi:hypothetical protein
MATELTCHSGRYWPDVGCTLREANWLATVGVPLFVTIASIALAYLFLRRQIGHDIRLRRADRISHHVNAFGALVVAEVDSIDQRKTDDEWWSQPSWTGWTEIWHALRDLRRQLRDPLAYSSIDERSMHLLQAWRACVARRLSLEKQGTKFSAISVGMGMDAALTAVWSDLRLAGIDLMTWDGIGLAPTGQSSLLHRPKGPRGKRTEAQRRWDDFYADEFERVARKRTGEH